MKRQVDKEGHLLVDHRASPGIVQADLLTTSMRMPEMPGGKQFEAATLTCCHCNRVVIKNPQRLRDRGFCRKCNHFVCDNCSGKECTSVDKSLDYKQEQIWRADNSYNPLPLLDNLSPLVKGT